MRVVATSGRSHPSTRTLAKLRRLAVALHAVSTSPPMPQWRAYVRAVDAEASATRRVNPRGEVALRADLARVARGTALGVDASASDLLTALTSFVDDYAVPPPTPLFVVPRALAILDALEERHDLTVAEQLTIALQPSSLIRPTLFEATLALHTATRVLARGRDTRLDPRFAMSLGERLARGRAIAPFHPDDARGGDPLGDTYHFWANVSAGLYAAGGHDRVLHRRAVRVSLRAGPVLMSNVRERLFGSVLFYGNHARVDRLGLDVGIALARGLLEPTAVLEPRA